MKREEIYKEIGLIDDSLIEAAEHSGIEVRKKRISKRWVVGLVVCLVLYSSTSTALLATEYYKKQNTEPYIRYLTAESMELQPFLEHENQKISDAAAFAVDLLSKSFESPYIVHLADGSKVFTLFNNYSDYGSQNVLWRIKDNVLEEYLHFSAPAMYIREMIPSPDGRSIAIVMNSNKSDFVDIIHVEEGMHSPELVESARVKYGAQKQLDTWIRTDHENYSYVNNIMWEDNDTVQFEAFLSYEDMSMIETVTVTYQFSNKIMEVKEVE